MLNKMFDQFKFIAFDIFPAETGGNVLAKAASLHREFRGIVVCISYPALNAKDQQIIRSPFISFCAKKPGKLDS